MHELRIIEKATGEVVETIDVSQEIESDVSLIRWGVRNQMNPDEFRLEEVKE